MTYRVTLAFTIGTKKCEYNYSIMGWLAFFFIYRYNIGKDNRWSAAWFCDLTSQLSNDIQARSSWNNFCVVPHHLHLLHHHHHPHLQRLQQPATNFHLLLLKPRYVKNHFLFLNWFMMMIFERIEKIYSMMNYRMTNFYNYLCNFLLGENTC